MARYVADWPGQWHGYDEDPPKTCTVMEPEPGRTFSGLYDHHGRPLYRVESRQPIGFVLNKGGTGDR